MRLYELFKIEPKKEKMFEGGNSRAIDSDGNIMLWKGEPAYAQKMDLTKHGRSNVRDAFVAAFDNLNKAFEKQTGTPIWADFRVITSGHAFNGSSESFFDPDIEDKLYVKHKPKVGDIDVSVPKDVINDLWDFLKGIEGKNITDKVIYVGNNKKAASAIGEQINAVFDYTDERGTVLGQVDFEASEFEDNKPSEWAKFSHSSDWADIESGIKGVFHKFLLQSVANVLGKVKDSVELTPASTVVDPKKVEALAKELEEISTDFEEKEKFVIDNKIKPEPEIKGKVKEISKELKDLKKKKTELEKEIKKSIPKIPKAAEGKDVSELTFSVLYGLRNKMQAQKLPDGSHFTVGGKKTYKAMDPATSGYINRPVEMFEKLFGSQPSTQEIKQFRSFVGLLDLVEEYRDDPQSVKDLRDEFIRRLWGFRPEEALQLSSPDEINKYKVAQALERDRWEIDKDIKVAALDRFSQKFPETKLPEKVLQKILFIYYGKEGEAYQRLRSAGTDSDEIKG